MSVCPLGLSSSPEQRKWADGTVPAVSAEESARTLSWLIFVLRKAFEILSEHKQQDRDRDEGRKRWLNKKSQ